MGNRGNIVKFRKRQARAGRPSARIGRWRFGPSELLTLVVVGSLLGLTGLTLTGAHPEEELSKYFGGNSQGSSSQRSVTVSWVDGDSGTLNGRGFRLHGVDAPEGSPDLAECAQERALSAKSRSAARSATTGKRVVIARTYGEDRYGRLLVDLSTGGRDVASRLVTGVTCLVSSDQR